MKITQAWSQWVDGHVIGSHQGFWFIIGLGDDNKIYRWVEENGEWELHANRTAPPTHGPRDDKDAVNLDEIPF